ncbi:translation initiation factor EF-1 [Plasmodium gonderi]|uniref:Translation initiation factor EF-1 n=1 Tax=Plasmodium gonderi TaxID=77519 RepID=A0A1Y1JLS2_PLAGO|nr:translation initiation factor EF-1 [Plasmodium gonderi]GAW82395.1 translation initiation factor EF-1 [Plasmodium gonderi]
MYQKVLLLFILFIYTFRDSTNALTRKNNLFINEIYNNVDTFRRHCGSGFNKNKCKVRNKTKCKQKSNKFNQIYNKFKDFHATKENDVIEMNGIVDECLANTNFVVRIPNGEKFLCFISGKLRINKVKINLGDTVKIQIHKLNFEKRRGKIVFRYLQHAPLGNKK